MLYFLNERCHGTRNLQKDLPLGPLQLGVNKNSKDLLIWILEFDDVTIKPVTQSLVTKQDILAGFHVTS